MAAIATGLGALAVYRTTLLPGVGLWDTAEAQVVLPAMGTMHPTGFPAYVLLGWLASVVLQPLGSPAFTINLLSAILAGFAAGTCVLVLRRLAVPLPIGIAVAAGFALTPIVWGIGSAADAHALHIALLVALTLALLRWGALVAELGDHPDDPALRTRADRAIVLAAGVFGLAAANHALSLLLLPAIGLYVLAVEPGVLRRRSVVAGALAVGLGTAALLYLEMPLRAGPFPAPLVYGHPDTWSGFWQVVLARQFGSDVGGLLADPGGRVGTAARVRLGPVRAPGAAGPGGPGRDGHPPSPVRAVLVHRHARHLPVRGLVPQRCDRALLPRTRVLRLDLDGRPGDRASGTGEPPGPGPDPDPDGERFPPDEPAGVSSPGEPGGLGDPDAGAGVFPRDWRPRLSPADLVAAMVGLTLLVPTGLLLDSRWRAEDRSRETWAADWLDQAFVAVKPDAVILSWWSFSTPIWYGQIIEGRRPDVLLLDDRVLVDENLGGVEDVIDRYLGTRPVYVIRAQESDVTVLAQRYAIEPVGRPDNLYLVTGSLETQP